MNAEALGRGGKTNQDLELQNQGEGFWTQVCPRSCHCPLAGKQYYNKAGIPLCADCYQASLELCWACGEAITDQVVRALERAYHVTCFTCATCKQQIGEQAFAQGEVGEVYCLEDYYRY
ncbi:unnamed protein product [Tetraodon nigroviridis]|uniref:(spotted green pufferfish) hypothetical protein n=1 Tax=Tetraodon nigroviridis TaxID=99883 RepID=Q4RXM4_TETNG|nr:unnamed protein product [Tetraodon nigroviridis]